MHPDTDSPARFAPGAQVEVDGRALVVQSSASSERGLLVGFHGIVDRSAAESLRGREVTIPESERRQLDEGEFWPDQLVGLEVRSQSGGRIGMVVGFVEGPAQGRLSIDTGAGFAEIPFVEALVPVVDVESGFLVVAEVEGLL